MPKSIIGKFWSIIDSSLLFDNRSVTLHAFRQIINRGILSFHVVILFALFVCGVFVFTKLLCSSSRKYFVRDIVLAVH